MNIENRTTYDSGDSTIMGCNFLGSYATNTAVHQKSSGGLKVIGNKILGIHSVGYRLTLDEGATTSILLLEGNSIENCLDVNILLSASVTVGSYNMINILGNELAGAPVSIQALGVDLANLRIENNQIVVGVGSGFGQGVSLEGPQGFSVKNNTFMRGGTGSLVCVGVGTTAANGEIGGNVYGSDIPVASRVSNASTTTKLLNSTQRGTASGVTSGAVGPLWQNAAGVVVNFPQEFLAVPNVTTTVSNGNNAGGIAAPVDNTGTTGFVAKAVGLTQDATVQFDWQASGPLG